MVILDILGNINYNVVMANEQNLIPLSSREAREISEMGKKGAAVAKQRKKERKLLKDSLLLLLECGNAQENICAALLAKAEKGDTKAFEIIRDSIGEKPVDKVEQINVSSLYSQIVGDIPEVAEETEE